MWLNRPSSKLYELDSLSYCNEGTLSLIYLFLYFLIYLLEMLAISVPIDQTKGWNVWNIEAHSKHTYLLSSIEYLDIKDGIFNHITCMIKSYKLVLPIIFSKVRPLVQSLYFNLLYHNRKLTWKLCYSWIMSYTLIPKLA